MLDKFEAAAVVQCLHLVSKPLNLGSVTVVAAALHKLVPEVDIKAAQDALNGKAVSHAKRSVIAAAALKLMSQRESEVLEALPGQDARSVSYLKSLFDEHLGRVASGPATAPAGAASPVGSIWSNWVDSSLQTPDFWGGAYQIVRRYKARNVTPGDESSDDEQRRRELERDIVIFEVLFVDAESRNAVLVTSERNVYRGATFFNDEKILSIIFQRPRGERGVNQRYVTAKLEDVQLPVYSGLSVKVGNTTFRPLAADTLFIPLAEDEHADAYAALRTLATAPWLRQHKEIVPADSVICDYITDNPPPAPFKAGQVSWRRVKFLHEFPELQSLATANRWGMINFTEPTRTIGHDELLRIANTEPPSIFRHSIARLALQERA